MNPPTARRKAWFVLVLSVLVLAATSRVRADSIINGDFETGDLTGWMTFTTGGGKLGTGLPNVVLFDTDNDGLTSLAAQFRVGQVGFTEGVLDGGGIFQNVLLGEGSLTITADIAAAWGACDCVLNGSAGLFELLLDGVLVDSHDFEEIFPNTTEHGVLSYVGSVSGGTHEIRIQMTRAFHGGDTTPAQYIDNVAISGSAVESSFPMIFIGGIVNNASYALDPAPLAPGSIVAIYGTNLNDGSQNFFSGFGEDGKLLTTLGGTSIKINGISAPVFYSFPGQVGVQIPFELGGESSASVELTVAGHSSEPRTIFLEPAVPGIFTLDEEGTGQGAVLLANSDVLAVPQGSIPGRTSQPAERGQIITIFCTGLGAVVPLVETGAAAGTSQTPTPATVTIDGLPAMVHYSGTAPEFAGLYQINVTVPEGSRVGDDVSLVVSMGNRQSNPVTIAVGP